MPLTRYEIRNEYTLADPELYRAADKDDPEALLEGVAMAGLVGVLRQLGDLAEFASEIFHDLHEEVMVTAARGHGLVVRVQQLEAEVPSIEKAFLSQTNHTPFFSNAGIDWHPNLQTKQNMLTGGDLPRCVMDSYEECRGPPRLFLLDKFDVAGAGACLKRYTDPSFVKAEAGSTTGVYREKKIRKAKKKGSRWRNGENREVLIKPKLQQLLLEERVENGFSDPARLVKLKRRQLNDPNSGRSYMEKFLETPSPENKTVRDISVAPLALKSTPGSFSESGLEVVDIKTMSSAEKLLVGKGNYFSSSPDHEGFNGHANDRRIVPVSEVISDGENDHPGMVFEKELFVDRGNIEGSIDGENSENLTSEVENYMDALATMESDTDNEYNISRNFPNAKKGGTDSDGNEEQLKVQVQFSDSQSIGNSSVSDDGNGSFKRGQSSFSCSDDTLSNLAETNVPYDGEAASTLFPSNETYISTDTLSNNHHAYLETKPNELEDKKLDEVEGMSGMQGDENLSVGSDESNSKCLNSEDSICMENSNDKSIEESLQTDHVDETCTQELGDAKIGSPRSIAEDQFLHSAELPVEDLGSLSKVVDTVEDHSLREQQLSCYVPEEPEVPYSEEHANPNCISMVADGGEIYECHSNKDLVDDLGSFPPDDPSCNDNVSSGAIDDDNKVSEDLVSSQSVHLEESISGSTYLPEEINVVDSSQSVSHDDIHDSSLEIYIQNSSLVDNSSSTATDVESEYPDQGHVLENKDDTSSPSHHLTESVTDQVEVECEQADEASSSSHLLSDCHPIAASEELMGEEIDHTNREMNSSFSFAPSSDSIPQNEMPPMPPLQWRMGKVTQDQQNPFLFPSSMPPFSSHEDTTRSGFPAFDTLPENQFTATKDMGPQYVSEELTNHHVVQPTPLPSHEFFASASEIQEHGLKLFSAAPVTEDTSSRQDDVPSDENRSQPSPEIYMDGAQTHQQLTNDSHSNPSDTASSSSLARGEEEPHLQTLDGQLAWPSNAMALAPTFEVETPYGNTVPKIPRPRSPLVDALAAHDKSMLRKVSDRPRARPQIEPKVEERDSLLQQIRTKSFNLKPALVSRPSIQGPKTNLRLAAILEKANAIRQATAGSDEDDDDSWSDE